jgi:hypothetical protein
LRVPFLANPLADKLGVKPDKAVLIVAEHLQEIADATAKAANVEHAAALTAAKAKAAAIVILTLDPAAAEKQIAAAAKALGPATALWLVYRKGLKPNGDDIIMLARKAGLKDTKVARISETHAGLADEAQARERRLPAGTFAKRRVIWNATRGIQH